jgi:tripartite-type tricarboxylate transporter receptor subunit TctC
MSPLHPLSERRHALKMLVGSALTGSGLLVPAATKAQDKWPSKPIKILVGTAPGGSADLVLRPTINQLSPKLGQPLILEHRPGANQTIAVGAVAKAAPDGYTLGFATDAPMSLAPALPAPLPYQPAELTPIAVMEHVSLVLVTHVQNPITSLANLVARAKANPGKISYGSLGIGSIAHIALEIFAMENGIELLHVPYSGTGPAVMATAARDVDLTFVSVGVVLPHIPGRLKAIAMAGIQRSPLLPNTPTFLESGYKEFEVRAWFGIVAPRLTPEPIVTQLRREIWNIVSTDDFEKNVLAPMAAEKSTVPPDRLEAFMLADQRKWAEWVKRLGARVKLI